MCVRESDVLCKAVRVVEDGLSSERLALIAEYRMSLEWHGEKPQPLWCTLRPASFGWLKRRFMLLLVVEFRVALPSLGW